MDLPNAPQTEENDREVVKLTPLHSVRGLDALVQENTVFMRLDTVEGSMVVHHVGGAVASSPKKSHSSEQKRIVENWVVSELVVGRVLVRSVVHQGIAHPIERENSLEPHVESIDVGHLVNVGNSLLNVLFVWDVIGSVSRVVVNLFSGSSESSDALADQ